jgi:hypothetical protein
MTVDVSWLFRHTVTVEELLGQTGAGRSYGPPVTVKCLITEARRNVVNAEGREVVSERGFICGPGENVNPGDRVTIRGRASTVITVSTYDGGGWPTPDNMEVACG